MNTFTITHNSTATINSKNSCGHAHRTISGAVRCLNECHKTHGWNSVVHSDGSRLTEDESSEICAEEARLMTKDM